jgi:hypothetical protein
VPQALFSRSKFIERDPKHVLKQLSTGVSEKATKCSVINWLAKFFDLASDRVLRAFLSAESNSTTVLHFHSDGCGKFPGMVAEDVWLISQPHSARKSVENRGR